MLELIKEWWGPLVGGTGMFASYVAGRERTRSRIREVSDDLSKLQIDLTKIADQVASQNVQLASINANLEWLKRNAERG